MHILHVTPYISLDPEHGGIPPAVQRMTEGLAATGSRVTVLCSDWGSPVQLDRVKVLRMRSDFSRLASFFNTPLTLRMISVDDKLPRDIDVIHLHGFWTFQNVVGYLLARKRNLPYVLQPHGSLGAPLDRPISKPIFLQAFGRRLIRNAAACIALEDSEATAYRRLGVEERRIKIIPNPSEPPAPSGAGELPAGALLSRTSESQTVGFIGRLNRTKRLDLLIAAIAILKKRGEKVRCLIAGPDGGAERSLRRLVAKHGLQDRVTFLGVLSEDRKWQFLKGLGALVIPAFTGFPVTIVEALKTGTPTVVTS